MLGEMEKMFLVVCVSTYYVMISIKRVHKISISLTNGIKANSNVWYMVE